MSKHSESDASAVPKQAKQDAQEHGQEWSWVEACVWNERMLAALDNGVKGGKWFSLIDKVYQPATLQAARAEPYLGELEAALKAVNYHAHPWTFSGMDGFIRWP